MAVFAAVVDPDPLRRSAFAAAVQRDLARVTGLGTGTFEAGTLSVVWAAAPGAPVETVRAPAGSAFLLGLALDRAGRPAGAGGLLRAWASGPQDLFDGYHVGLVHRADGTIVAGGDPLGLFPLYGWTDGAVLLLGASPEPFRRHPAFRPALDVDALAGVLLAHALVDGHALWKGVLRPGIGCVLTWRAPGPLASPEVCGLPRPASGPGPALVDAVDRMHRVLNEAVLRHLAAAPPTRMLLSGGLDSRLLAGYLHRHGLHPAALTLGTEHDLEVRCARRVARRLGLTWAAGELDPERHVAWALRDAAWGHLAGGFSALERWGLPEALGPGGPVVAGYALDFLVGPHMGTHAHAGIPPAEVFAHALAGRFAWGFPPAALEDLLLPEVGAGTTARALARLRAAWEAGPTDLFARLREFHLRHRARHHVGAHLWGVAHAGWPFVPWLDRQVVETCLSLPMEVMEDRRAERALLARHFRDLARLPLEQNRLATTPVLRTPLGRAADLLRRVGVVRRAERRWLRRHGEVRRFYRVYDVDGPGWRAVREQAQGGRQRLDGLLSRPALDRWLPPPSVPIAPADPIAGSGPAKLLLGLILWADGRL